jgi:hypothetical protein
MQWGFNMGPELQYGLNKGTRTPLHANSRTMIANQKLKGFLEMVCTCGHERHSGRHVAVHHGAVQRGVAPWVAVPHVQRTLRHQQLDRRRVAHQRRLLRRHHHPRGGYTSRAEQNPCPPEADRLNSSHTYTSQLHI